MNHVSVSPTDGNEPTQGQRKTLTRVGIGIEIEHFTLHSIQLTLFKKYKCYTANVYIKRNLSLYLHMFIAVTLTSPVPTACSRLTL